MPASGKNLQPGLLIATAFFLSIFCAPTKAENISKTIQNSSNQEIIYVSPNGGEVRHDGRNFVTTTIDEALDDAKPGQTVQLTPGIYRQKIRIDHEGEMEKPIAIRGLGETTVIDGGQKLQSNDACIVINNARWITLSKLHIRNCWRDAIKVKNSEYITFKESKVIDSRNVVYARGEDTHHILIEKIHWIQDPSGKVWHTIPWAESHHGSQNHLNGAIFQAKDILGSVIIRDNHIRYAFNGVRVKGNTNNETLGSNVEIYNNRFEYIRDNPIEPEINALNWWVHHNKFFNGHAIFSLTNVAGGFIYIFRNVSWHDQAPGGKLTSAKHTGGKIFKFQSTGPYPSQPIFVFNNSWLSRSPLIAGGNSRHFYYWNNATQFSASDIPHVKANDWHKTYKSDFNLSSISFAKAILDTGEDKNSIVSDKKFFISPELGDFRIDPSSPALDAGKPLEIAGWKSEFRGKAPDIGAYEGNQVPDGPYFQFMNLGYEEHPRVVGTRVNSETITLFLSVPMKKNDKLLTTAADPNTGQISLQCMVMEYAVNCTANQKISLMNVTSIYLTKELVGKNGLATTTWGAHSGQIEILKMNETGQQNRVLSAN